MPASWHVHHSVQRLAVIFPETSRGELAKSYQDLEDATLRLKTVRPDLRILDRQHSQAVFNEQRLQLSGVVSDEESVGIGRMLGADSILIYAVEGMTWREKLLAQLSRNPSSVIIRSQLIAIESGEILFSNVVTVPLQWTNSNIDDGFSKEHVDLALQAAFNSAMDRTIADLKRALADKNY